MYFAEKILNQPLILDPWAHQIVNDIIDPDLFVLIQQQCQPLLSMAIDSNFQLYPRDFSKYGLRFERDLNEISNDLLDNFKTIIKRYPYHRLGLKHIVDAHLSITPPKPYTYELHDESPEKVLSIVVYVTPDQNTGTILYTDRNESSYVKSIPWQPNSALVFCGQDNVTWHSYQSDSLSNRVTLNLFVKSSIDLTNRL